MVASTSNTDSLTGPAPATFGPGSLDSALFDRLGLAPSAHFLVAFSGGPDSVALLHGMAQLRRQRPMSLRAAHFNHGWHDDAGKWADWCRGFADSLDVECLAGALHDSPTGETNREAIARQARYRWLASVAGPGEVVLTAHHANDQAETFLMHLFQGRSAASLGGVQPLRPLLYGSGTLLARPLLEHTREQLADYLAANGLDYIDDPANLDCSRYRNFIRHRLLPVLEQRNPDLVPALVRAAGQCRAWQAREQQRIDAGLDAASDPGSTGVFDRLAPLSLARLDAVDAYDFAALMAAWLHRAGLSLPPAASLEALHGQLGAGRARLASGEVDMRLEQGRLHLLCLPQDGQRRDRDWDLEPLQWAGLGIRLEPAAAGLDARRLAASRVRLVWRRGGEKVRLPGRRHRHSLKKLLNEGRIPSWERQVLPLLEVDGDIAWVPGIGACAPLLANGDGPAVLPVIDRPEISPGQAMPD